MTVRFPWWQSQHCVAPANPNDGDVPTFSAADGKWKAGPNVPGGSLNPIKPATVVSGPGTTQTIAGGNSPDSVPGNLTLVGGDSAGGAGAGGRVTISGGAGDPADSDGGYVQIQGHDAAGTGSGGGINLQGANAPGAGTGGQIIITPGTSSAGTKGSVSIRDSAGTPVIKVGPVVGTLGFYNHAPTALQTGVAVSAAGIHAALVNLGLITA